MCKKTVVSFGFGVKFAFDTTEQAVEFYKAALAATPVEKHFVINKSYVVPDDAEITLMQSEFLTIDQYNELRLEETA